eukprot:3473673-Pleurochrysis_carterae.AAC.1
MMWVLRKKKDEKGELLKYKAQPALASGTEHIFETVALAAQSATFKLLCAVGCIANLRVRQFDVEAAYLQGKFKGDDDVVYVRLPPHEHFFDDRGMPIVWKLLKPLHGKADAGGSGTARGRRNSCCKHSVSRSRSSTRATSTSNIQTDIASTWCCTWTNVGWPTPAVRRRTPTYAYFATASSFPFRTSRNNSLE